MRIICVDTGFLIALYTPTPRDSSYHKATRYFKDYFEDKPNSILIPWPILYETVRTKFVENRISLIELTNDWSRLESRNRLILSDDSNYRMAAFKECGDDARREFAQYRNLSLADRVIRKMLEERNLNITALITLDAKDFSDVCKKTNCELIDLTY